MGKRERSNSRERGYNENVMEVGPLPEVVNPERRAACERNYRIFQRTYFASTFYLPSCPDHDKVDSKIEAAVLSGGLFAMAMPRGSGKTSRAECAALWAILYGHRRFPVLIGCSEAHALEMLESIKTEIEVNELLAEDFPEVCYPIARLEGQTKRAIGQTVNGQRTQISWTADEIVLPTVAGSKASGAIVRVTGITGRIRGMKFKRPDGETVRPDFVIPDDPQTDESAWSPAQCAKRERILAGAILGLAGPGKKISGIMPCTVIRKGDMADNMLDPDKHPEWNGERTKMVYVFPTNEKLWGEYAEIQAESFRAGHGGKEATEFYAAHREAMDAGAVIAWPARFNPDELSAVQNAMNLKIRDEDAFFAEYQNEPIVKEEHVDNLTAEQIAIKVNGLAHGDVPVNVSYLTSFIDIQEKALFWGVAGWSDTFTGYVLDYGTFPEQPRPYFTLRDIKPTLAEVVNISGLEGVLYAGLERLTDLLLNKKWSRDDGAEIQIDRCLIDANWGESTEVVYQFCRQTKHAAVVMPSHGKFVGASSLPFSDYKKKQGERVGHNWRIPNVAGKRAVRHIVYDTNYWKSFLYQRLAVPMGAPGCLSLFGDKPGRHRLLADHLTAEYRVRTEGRGRVVDEWQINPSRPDNHWLDCLVGCAVAASERGARLHAAEEKKPKTAKVSFAEMQRIKKQERMGRR